MLIETKAPRSEELSTRKPRHRWHAVTIVAPSRACEAALACKGKRFLSSEAPRLPLAQCDADRCNCKYRHFEDRRAGPRRSAETGAPEKRTPVNRREKRGRRSID
jgi:hypothetical protein